ncbi:MAG: APC family permease [Gemmatimonadaceae bacterium]
MADLRARSSASPSVPDDAAGSSHSSLIRAVGLWGLAAGITNVTIGGGIFRLPAAAANALGSAAPIAYVVCALAMGLIVMCIAEAGSRVTLTGGPYAYVETAFGPYLGFMTGVLLWLGGTLAVSGVANVFVDNFLKLLLVEPTVLLRASVLACAFVLATTINLVGVKQGNRLNLVLTVAKLAPLLLLVVVGVFSIQPTNLHVAELPSAQSITRASMILVFAFAGVESALVPSGEVKDPARTVPRAIFIAVLGIALLYIALQFVAQGVLGSALAKSTTPLADAAGLVFGPSGRSLLMIGVVISTFGYVSGMTLAVPRALFAFARDGFLPKQVAVVHPRWKTPWIAILVQSVIMCVLAITSGFEQLAIIANVALLLVYLACALAALQLRRMGVQGGGTPFKVPGAAIVPVLACLVIVTLLTSITASEWLVVLEVGAVATVIFLASRSYRNQLARQTQ